MPTCRRCGEAIERPTRGQTHCPRCDQEVRDLIRTDRARATRRTFTPKELTRW